MEIKWIKLSTALFDNRKIKQIRKMPDGDALIVIWLQILCLAGVTNDSGLVYFSKDIPYTEEMLATEFDRPITTIRLALNVFEQFGMVEIVNNILLVSNWEKYQSVDQMEKIREQNRLRKQKQRAQLTECHVTCHADVTQGHATDIDKDIDKDKEEEKRTKAAPPTNVFASYSFSDPMKAKLTDWLSYKKERKESYKPTGLTAFLSGVKNRLEKHDEADIIALIDECMANNWKGIIWDKLPPPKPKVHIMPPQTKEPQTLEEIFGVEYD